MGYTAPRCRAPRSAAAADCARLRLTRLGTDGTTLGECPEWHNHSLTHSQQAKPGLPVCTADCASEGQRHTNELPARHGAASPQSIARQRRDVLGLGKGWAGMGWAGPIGAQISCGSFARWHFYALPLRVPRVRRTLGTIMQQAMSALVRLLAADASTLAVEDRAAPVGAIARAEG